MEEEITLIHHSDLTMGDEITSNSSAQSLAYCPFMRVMKGVHLLPVDSVMKTHVHGFFDTDLHEVNWHFATHEAVRPSGFEDQLTEWRWVSKKPFKMGFCFYPTIKM